MTILPVKSELVRQNGYENCQDGLPDDLQDGQDNQDGHQDDQGCTAMNQPPLIQILILLVMLRPSLRRAPTSRLPLRIISETYQLN